MADLDAEYVLRFAVRTGMASSWLVDQGVGRIAGWSGIFPAEAFAEYSIETALNCIDALRPMGKYWRSSPLVFSLELRRYGSSTTLLSQRCVRTCSDRQYWPTLW